VPTHALIEASEPLDRSGAVAGVKYEVRPPAQGWDGDGQGCDLCPLITG
jgi:hypothetical protein